MHPLELNLQLARRIELAEAQAGAAAAVSLGKLRPETGACVKSIAGGLAAYAGAGSPVTQAVGLGLQGEISREDFAQLQSFYFKRNEPVRVEACPLAHASLFAHFGASGYRVTEFTNVMARRVPDRSETAAGSNGLRVRRVESSQIDLWNLTVAGGFSEARPVSPDLLNVMKAFALAEGVECYLAEIEGRAAGGATLLIRDGVAGLFGASTLPEFRKRGVQTALLHERLGRAAESGCDLAVCLAAPGSSSQRNIARLGFQALYTRVKFEKALEV
jgi:GNAT superfamily N-acetyltransferase